MAARRQTGNAATVTHRLELDALLPAVEGLRRSVEAVALPLEVEGAQQARREQAALIDQLDDYVLPRLRSLDAPLLAVVGGSTGAGKSTLVNSVLREAVTRSGVLRPTTRSPVLIHHPDDEAWFAGGRVLPGLARETGGRQRFAVMMLKPKYGIGYGNRDPRGLTGRSDVAGNTHKAGDVARGITDRELGGQAPTALAVGIPMQFELIPNRASGAQDFGVLGFVACRQIGRENLADGLADKIGAFLQADAAQQ